MCMNKQQIKDIAKLYPKLGPSKLAEKHGVSRQRIHQIVQALRKDGIEVPPFQGRLGYKQALKELKK